MLPEVLREYAAPEVQWMIYGALMILVVFWLPQGIVPAVRELWQRVGARQPTAIDGPAAQSDQGSRA
jgi:branched-chain amino acid transport system permease protein